MCKKCFNLNGLFQLSPYFTMFNSSSSEDEKLFLQLMMDGSPFYHHIQADIHYSWGHIKSPSHFPIWTNESQAHNLPPKRKTQPCQVTNLHFRRRWQCLFVGGGGLQIPIWARKEMGEITLISEWKQAQKSRISPFQLFNALEKTLNEKKHKNGKDQIYRFSFSTLLETAQNSQLGHIHVISLTTWNTLISHQRFGFMLFYIVEYVTVLLCSVCLFAINCFSFACSIVDSINAIMEYSL